MERQMKAHPLCDEILIPRPFCKVETRKLFTCRCVLNGVYVNYCKTINVSLTLAPYEVDCRSCGHYIARGELCGDEHSEKSSGFHCAFCIHIPAGLKVARIQYSALHKSLSRLDGIERKIIVHYLAAIQQYAQRLRKELHRDVIVEMTDIVLPVRLAWVEKNTTEVVT